MDHPSPSRRGRVIAWALAPAVALAGCGGFITVDGYEAAYVDAPPPGIEAYPRYEFRDGYLYDVNGRYYHQHGGRWANYRSAPPEVAPGRAQGRGMAEMQR